MTTERSVDRVEDFAQLCAQVNEGFDAPALVLAAAGLDESSWERFKMHWTTRLAEDVDNALAHRFSEAYTAECHRIACRRSPDGPPASDPRFLNDDAQPWREDAAAVQLDALQSAPPPLSFGEADTEDPTWPASQPVSASGDLDRTVEFATRRPGPALPFSRARGNEASGVHTVPAYRRIEGPRDVVLDAPDATVELSTSAARSPALPFAPPSSAGRRLHRFDSQTGQPLANPYWVDDAADPTRSA